MSRKKRLRFYQLSFFIAGFLILLFTYLQQNNPNQDEIISENLQKKIEQQLKTQENKSGNTFYNVKYSGVDLEGNRYSIISKEGTASELDSNIVSMKGVTATFYFKDETNLLITSDFAKYNNNTLDISFKNNVKALYQESKLFADEAKFSNSDSFLTVSKNVKVIDPKGTMNADKLLFDIEKKTLNIVSLKDNVIKSIINYK